MGRDQHRRDACVLTARRALQRDRAKQQRDAGGVAVALDKLVERGGGRILPVAVGVGVVLAVDRIVVGRSNASGASYSFYEFGINVGVFPNYLF